MNIATEINKVAELDVWRKQFEDSEAWNNFVAEVCKAMGFPETMRTPFPDEVITTARAMHRICAASTQQKSRSVLEQLQSVSMDENVKDHG